LLRVVVTKCRIQVDVVEAKSFKRSLKALADKVMVLLTVNPLDGLRLSMEHVPHFRGYENIFAGNPGCADCTTHSFLVSCFKTDAGQISDRIVANILAHHIPQPA